MGFRHRRSLREVERRGLSYSNIRNRTREEYGWIAKGRDFVNEPFHKQRIADTKAIISRFYEGGSVLDVGWGGVPMLYGFADGDYVGVDYLFNNRQKHPLVQPIASSFDELPFNTAFGFIIWCEGPEHSLSPYRTLEGLKKICKNRIFVSCPDGGLTNWEHPQAFNIKTLTELLNSRFKVLETGKIPPFWIYGVGEVPEK